MNYYNINNSKILYKSNEWRLIYLSRTYEMQKKYNNQKNILKQNNISLKDNILNIINTKKVKCIDNICIIDNDYPYSFYDNTLHKLIWDIREKSHDINEVIDISKNMIFKVYDKNNYDIIIFENNILYKSIPNLVHYHIFLRPKKAPIIDKIKKIINISSINKKENKVINLGKQFVKFYKKYINFSYSKSKFEYIEEINSKKTLQSFIKGFILELDKNSKTEYNINKIDILNGKKLLEKINKNKLNNDNNNFNCIILSKNLFEDILINLCGALNYHKPNIESTLRFEKWSCINYPNINIINVIYNETKIKQYIKFI